MQNINGKRKNGRNDNRQGTITKLKNGTYMGKIMMGYKPDGKPNRKTVYGKTKSIVREKLTQLASKADLGILISSPNMDTGSWFSKWLTEHKKISLKPTTYDCYESIINNNIIPRLGGMKLKELKSEHIQNLVNDLYNNGEGVSTATLRKIYVIIKSALNKAVYDGIILKNPACFIQLAKHDPKDVTAFSVDEQKQFEEVAKDYRLYSAFIINLDTGLRLGELLALKWDDIDFDKRVIKVRRDIAIVKDRTNKTKNKRMLIEQTTKTKKSKRDIPLTDRATEILIRLKQNNQSISTIIFCSRTGTHVSPRNYNRTFEKIINKAGIRKCSPHTLRHYVESNIMGSNLGLR